MFVGRKDIGAVVLLLSGIGIVLALMRGNIDRFTFPGYESSAVASLRNIYVANVGFAQSHPQQGYALTLSQLVLHPETSNVPEWAIDPQLGSGQRYEYAYRYVSHETRDGKVDSYEVFADPIIPRKARRHFFLDQTGIVRMSDTWPAGKASSALN